MKKEVIRLQRQSQVCYINQIRMCHTVLDRQLIIYIVNISHEMYELYHQIFCADKNLEKSFVMTVDKSLSSFVVSCTQYWSTQE